MPRRLTSFFSQPVEDLWPDDPWERLQWWESPWQARAGIKALCRMPFLHLSRANEEHAYVPTRYLYSFALQADDEQRIGQAADRAAASVRQARELYTAAMASGMTDLARPLLFYYSAVALAKAAGVALFGVEHLNQHRSHGLGDETGSSSQHPQGVSWPTLIVWQQTGTFAMLYRAARWDTLYQCCTKHSKWGRTGVPGKLRFHVLECIRWLGYEWGTLPHTNFSRPSYVVTGPEALEQGLRLYQDGQTPYMTRETPLDVPIFQLPRVVVHFMLLYYFSILARYHETTWQELLAGATEPEGYVFRNALGQVAGDFVREISLMLPLADEGEFISAPQWSTPNTLDALISSWYYPPTELLGAYEIVLPTPHSLDEWKGIPPKGCS